jgi:uncharacterized membrane protein
MLHSVVWWVILIVGIVLLVRLLRGGDERCREPPPETALDVLKKRYVRGESRCELDRDQIARRCREQHYWCT